ncbi:MAG TPA: biopolymer transporter ExbD, partial [Isosphaeraceae bacterium]
MRLRSDRVAVLALAALMPLAAARSQDFDRLEGQALAAIPKSPDVTAHQRLSLAELGNLPRVLRGERSALVVAQTDRGNLCRLLVAGALRKAPGAEGEPAPVLVLER